MKSIQIELGEVIVITRQFRLIGYRVRRQTRLARWSYEWFRWCSSSQLCRTKQRHNWHDSQFVVFFFAVFVGFVYAGYTISIEA